MSTSILGYKADVEIGDLYKRLYDLRPLIKNLATQKLARALITEIVDTIDTAHRTSAPCPKPWSLVGKNAYAKIQSNRKNNTRDPDWDADFTMTLFPEGPVTYIMPYAEQRSWLSVLENFPDTRDYSWQNSTDRPKDVSAQEWEEREVLWTRLLKPSGWIPKNAGLSLDYSSANLPRDPEDILPYIPSEEERARKWAKAASLDAWANARRAATPPQGGQDAYSTSQLISYMYSLDHINAVEQTWQDIVPNLKPITLSLIKDGF
jgi:hypothetical protein